MTVAIFTIAVLFVATLLVVDVFSILKVYGFPTKSHEPTEEALEDKEFHRNPPESTKESDILHYFGEKDLRYVSREQHMIGIPFYHISTKTGSYIVIPGTNLYKKIYRGWDDQPVIQRRHF